MIGVPPGPSTYSGCEVTVQLTVKVNGVSAPKLLANETVPVTGDPTDPAVQVRLKVVVASAASEVEPKLVILKPEVTVGGLVRVKVLVPVLRTVIVWTSGVRTGVIPML